MQQIKQTEQKEFTRKNLERVLEELPKLAKKMPEIINDFYMVKCGVYEGLEKENLSRCSSAGCLLGNAARVFVDEFTDDLYVNNKFNYDRFSRKFFPYLYDSCIYQGAKWFYLFSENWAKTKFKDLDSALQRIKNLLANDLECSAYRFETNKIIN